MKRLNWQALAITSASGLALLAMPPLAHAQTESESAATESDAIIVTGINAPTTSSTGLALTFMETPQSVTIIDQKRIRDYALTGTNDLLEQVVGINVEDLETDRTTFNSRGFDIANFQIDGIGLPLIGSYLTYGDTDSYLYERVDIIRGANGLTTGIGTPSATINYIRKRPVNEFQAGASIYAGSWNHLRVEGDVSIPLSDNWAVRLIGAHEESDSYLDKYNYERNVFGVIASGELTPDLTFTAGYNRQEHEANASTWVGLWMFYSDGTPIDYDQSDNSAPSWAVWPTANEEAFAELAYDVNDWTIKGIVTLRNFEDAPRLLNLTGYPDRPTGFYLGDTSEFETEYDRVFGDVYASGPFSAFGQEHQLSVGLSYAHGDQLQSQGRAVDTGFGLGAIVLPDFNGPDRFNPPLPTYNPLQVAQDQTDEQLRAYAAAQINFTDDLHLVAGASWTKVESEGFSYGQPINTSQEEFNPYAGVLYDLTSNFTLYASYTTIFNPQIEQDITRTQLSPVEGDNLEGGIKANLFDGRLYATATVFRTEQRGLARFVGSEPDPVFGNFFYYEAVGETVAEGFEIELAGRVTENWELSGGYSDLEINDQTGASTRVHIPRQTLKLSTTYNVPEFNNFSAGAQLRWQSDIDTALTDQDAYTIVDLMTGIDVTEHVRASVVVRNVTDELYLTSLIYGDFGIGQYAAPRSFVASLSYRF